MGRLPGGGAEAQGEDEGENGVPGVNGPNVMLFKMPNLKTIFEHTNLIYCKR